MDIINEPAPQDLTGVIRLTTAAHDEERNTLAGVLPNLHIQDSVARVSDLVSTQADAAEVRAFDAEAPIGRPAEVTRSVIFDLPPVSQKLRVSEHQQIREGGASDVIARYAKQVGEAIADRVELFRGEALVTGGLNVNENGAIANVDFGRDAAATPQVTTSWEDTDATPLTDLLAWSDAYSDLNGVDASQLVISRAAFLKLVSNAEIVAAATGATGNGRNKPRVTPQGVTEVLGEYGFSVVVYDRKVKVAGTVGRVVPEDRVLMLPGDESIGRTVFGTTVEALEPYYGYNIAPEDAPGIVVGAFRNHDPAGLWVHGNAVAAPVLVNPNLAFAPTISA